MDNDPRQADPDQPSPDLQTRLKSAVVSLLSEFRSPIVIYSGIGCLAVLLIAATTVWIVSGKNYSIALDTHAPLPALSGSPQAAQHYIAKPSPIGHTQQSQPAAYAAPAPRAIAPRPVPQPAPVAPQPQPQYRAALVPPPAAPPAPVQRFAPSLPLGVRMSANRDGFSNGCKHGALVIEAATVTFTCPRDSSKSISVSARQVTALDDNGIVVFPRQKYHFDIAGKQKQAVHELFAAWLANAHRTATLQASN